MTGIKISSDECENLGAGGNFGPGEMRLREIELRRKSYGQPTSFPVVRQIGAKI